MAMLTGRDSDTGEMMAMLTGRDSDTGEMMAMLTGEGLWHRRNDGNANWRGTRAQEK